MLGAILILGIDRLALGHRNLVLEIPLHSRQLWQAQHVPVGVVAISRNTVGFRVPSNGCASQAVVLSARFDNTVFVAGINAGPAGIGRAGTEVLKLLKIPCRVVAKVFNISPIALPSLGCGRLMFVQSLYDCGVGALGVPPVGRDVPARRP